MRKQLLFTAVVSLFVACSQDAIEEKHETQTSMVNIPEKIYAEIDNVTSRTYVEEGNHLRWNEGDEISYFPGITYNLEYRFDGKTGDNSGSFTKITDKLVTGNELENTYAFYPYNEATSMSDEGIINFTFPATQSYAENSFGLGANAMVAVTDGKDDNILRFKNLCGYIKLKVYGDATIKSLTLKGNDDEPLAGAATITAIYGNDPVTTLADDATTTLIIDCGTGVTLGTTAEEATEFWFVVPSQSFAKGISIDITDINGLVMTQSTTKEVVIDRNTIQPMTVFEFNGKVVVPNNQIWYTATEKVEPNIYTYDSYIGFGANIISNEWDPNTGNGIITFDGEITAIGEGAFSGDTYSSDRWCKLTSITIPSSVKIIREDAFYCCNLESIEIPNSVEIIENYAFGWCGKLQNAVIGNGVTTIKHHAFFLCDHLLSLTIGNSVKTIEKWAFDGCRSIEGVTIPNSVETIEYGAFCNFDNLKEFKGKFSSDDSRSLIVNNTIIAYAESSGDTYTIPNSVTSIGQSAFEDCDKLTSITIPEGVTSIESQAFYHCDKLEKITIPASVTTFGDDAFGYCTNIETVYCKPIIPPIGGSSWFSSSLSWFTIFVPAESVFNYRTADGWSDYADDIYGYNFETSEYVPDDKLKPSNNQIWYTATSKIEPYATDVFGANIISNEWDETTGEGIITFDGDVYYLGENAFCNLDNLTNITIPNSIMTIGYCAFYGCENLTTITIPSELKVIGDSAFSGCSKLTNITIPKSVTTIGDSAFYGCSIATITIPNSFISIGSYAFSGCKGTLCIDNSNNMNVTCYVDSFSHELAYSGIFINSKFSEIIFGDNVSIIPQNAFRECYYLKTITFGNNIKYIEDNAFYGCSALTAVSLPDSIVSIGNGAFNGCSKMTDIYIPNSIMSIGNDAFYKCDNLSNVHIDDIAKWCEINFISSDANPLYYADNLYVNGGLIEGSVTLDKISAIGQYAFYDYDHISSITLPDSVTQIGAYAFNGCDNLCNINLGNGLKFIYEYAFRDCSNLTDIHLCDGIIMINDYAFSRCSSLTKISIPNSITTIGEGAFSNCSSLSEVFCKATTPPSIGIIAFSYNASGRKIYVPASDDDSIINAYKSTWSGFKSYIYEYEF